MDFVPIYSQIQKNAKGAALMGTMLLRQSWSKTLEDSICLDISATETRNSATRQVRTCPRMLHSQRRGSVILRTVLTLPGTGVQKQSSSLLCKVIELP